MEILDVYDNNGNTTGRIIIRGDKNAILNDNEHVAIAVIFIENSNGEFLIQKRSELKGGKYAFTGGHVDSGETPLDAIKREVKEEIGVNISNDLIEEYGFMIYDIPLRYIYYLKKDIDISDIKLQEDEVEYVKNMDLEQINELIETNQMLESHKIMFNEFTKRKNIKKR